jgi:HK97 family phage prohead protease
MAFHQGLGYEIAASGFGDIEYGMGGPIIAIDNRGIKHTPLRRAASHFEPKIVEGWACRWLKPHIYKHRIEVHSRGCFNETLSSKERVDLCIDHDRSYSLGNTDDNLELIDTPVGLAFRLRVKSQADFDLLQARPQMSTQYSELDVEVRDVNGSDVWFIKSAKLVECSAVFRGCVPDTHLVVRDSKTVGPLRDDSSGFSNDAAYAALQRALAKLL